jgi:hypothetical protein
LSFGGNPSAEESRQHMVYKRASGRVRKLKKVTTTAAPLTSSIEDEYHFPEHKVINKKNITITPRHMIKFEVEDAKYSEEYEQLKKSRKLRIKRAVTDNAGAKNGTYRMEKFIAPDTFMQPKEFLRFLITDAITSAPRDNTYDKKAPEEKKTAKRDTSAAAAGTTLVDSSASETFKKVKITHPLSSTSRTKHVSFEDLPAKLQKTIESALNDAVTRGKANDGDYLKIYYGDKVIKIPVSMSKQIATKPKETTTAKSIVESYVHKYPKEEEDTSYKSSFFKETPKYETKYETKYYYPSTTEKAESYVNFVTPKDSAPHVEEVHLPPKKSVYFFSSEEDKTPTFESLKNKIPATPSTIIFESSTPTSLSTFSDLSKNYENHIIHPTSSPSLGSYKTIIKEHQRETIPITEDVDDGLYNYKPIKSIQEIQHLDEHKLIPIPPPKSYIGFQGSTVKDEHVEKNYEFG